MGFEGLEVWREETGLHAPGIEEKRSENRQERAERRAVYLHRTRFPELRSLYTSNCWSPGRKAKM